jgi:hypothetical protein
MAKKPENRYSPHAATAILVVCGQDTWHLSEGARFGYRTCLFYYPIVSRLALLEGYIFIANIKVLLKPPMLIAQRKKTYCQNCHYPLTSNYNFCPQCGQENTDKRVAFNTLVQEFFANFIAYDSRLVKTVIPFLFKPGFLTNEFNDGRRVKYMHPLRLYFIVSFFYFFALALVYKEDATGVSYGQT